MGLRLKPSKTRLAMSQFICILQVIQLWWNKPNMGSTFYTFNLLAEEEVVMLMTTNHTKTCSSLDNLLSPCIICDRYNQALSSDLPPSIFKSAHVTH